MATRELLATLTSRGQITVPTEVQRCLGLKPHDRVAFTIDTDADEVRLRPARFTLEAVFGSVTPATETEAFKAIAHDAWDEKVEREVRKLEQP